MIFQFDLAGRVRRSYRDCVIGPPFFSFIIFINELKVFFTAVKCFSITVYWCPCQGIYFVPKHPLNGKAGLCLPGARNLMG